jgi:hypothetical protein
MGVAELLQRVQGALGISQRKIGDLLGVSRRSIIRWQRGGATLSPTKWETLARACYPRDRDIAVQCAAYASQTLQSLGLEQPVPPASAAAPAPSPRPPPSARHLADSVVCAAAEAMQLTPQAMRPGVFAAFERAAALGMTATEVLGAMQPE